LQAAKKLESRLERCPVQLVETAACAAVLEGKLQKEKSLLEVAQDLAEFELDTQSGWWADADKKVRARRDSAFLPMSLETGQNKRLGARALLLSCST